MTSDAVPRMRRRVVCAMQPCRASSRESEPTSGWECLRGKSDELFNYKLRAYLPSLSSVRRRALMDGKNRKGQILLMR